MKNILLVNSSPRVGGNSEYIVNALANILKDSNNITVFNMREHKCNPCLACGACQNKDYQLCVQKDDITELLPIIDQADAVLIATPIYNQQINSQAKLFIERWYPFFNFSMKNWSNSSKQGKKGALVCCFWGSPMDVTQKYAEWTVSGFSQIGAESYRTELFNGIPERGQIAEHKEYIERIYNLAKWLAE